MIDQNHFLTEGEKILWQKTFFDKEEYSYFRFISIVLILILTIVIIILMNPLTYSWIFLPLIIISSLLLLLIIFGFFSIFRRENYLYSYYITDKRVVIISKHPPDYEDYNEVPKDYIDIKENNISIDIGKISQFEATRKAKGVIYFYITYDEKLHSGMIFKSLDDIERNSIIEILTEKFGYKFKESYDIYDLYLK